MKYIAIKTKQYATQYHLMSLALILTHWEMCGLKGLKKTIVGLSILPSPSPNTTSVGKQIKLRALPELRSANCLFSYFYTV